MGGLINCTHLCNHVRVVCADGMPFDDAAFVAVRADDARYVMSCKQRDDAQLEPHKSHVAFRYNTRQDSSRHADTDTRH